MHFNPLLASEIAAMVDVPLIGPDFLITNARPLSFPEPHCITFAKVVSETAAVRLSHASPTLLIGANGLAIPDGVSALYSQNPRLLFAEVLGKLVRKTRQVGVHRTAIIGAGAQLGKNVSIGAGSVVESGATIGDESTIDCNVLIAGCVSLGKGVTVEANTVVGRDGFGYEKGMAGGWVKFPHIGSVLIEDDVEIGSGVTIDRGSLGNTIVRLGVRIDNGVHVAHNCDIGARSLLIAHAVLCGGVIIGSDCWIGPSATVMQKVSIGEGAKVGIGSVVLRDVPPGAVFMGVPAVDAVKFAAHFAELKRGPRGGSGYGRAGEGGQNPE